MLVLVVLEVNVLKLYLDLFQEAVMAKATTMGKTFCRLSNGAHQQTMVSHLSSALG